MMAAALIGCGNTVNTQTTMEGTTLTKEDNYTPDSTLRILMIGNSFCYYYVEELYELLMENPPEGIDAVEVYNLYYSGGTMTQHYTWWLQNESQYDLFKVDANGRVNLNNIHAKWSLEEALNWADWDYISLHGAMPVAVIQPENRVSVRDDLAAKAEPLFDRFHELHPHAQLLWQRTWFFEVGYKGKMITYTAQDGVGYNEGIQLVADYITEELDKDKPYDVIQVNTGAAWTEARKLNETLNLLPYGGLCAMLARNSFGDGRFGAGDGLHDGDIGGGQLLNAYVWYMTLTGNTDLSQSKYAPVYQYVTQEFPLSAELIDMLKQAAMTAIKK
jgi:hypothetical protein